MSVRTTILIAALLAPLSVCAQDDVEVYRLDASEYFGGGEPFETELTLTPNADGSVDVQHRARKTNASWGAASTGTGQWSGTRLRVSFDSSLGAAGHLGVATGFGSPRALSTAYYWSSGDELSGFSRLEVEGGGVTWIREEGLRFRDDPWVEVIPDRATFERLSRRDNVPGAMGIREVKFLVTDVGTPDAKIYFFDTNRFEYHYAFASQGLGLGLTLREFNQQTYFRDDRSFIAGSLLAHDDFEHPQTGLGIYTVEFWPTDPLKVGHVDSAYAPTVVGLPFAADRVYYHPAGETHERLYDAERPEFDVRQIRVIGTEELFGGLRYSPLNLGEGYGVLRLVDGSSTRPPSVRDVVIFRTLPNDLSHVAGVITELPQTPLSHINLKAKQNNTPNAYVKEISLDPDVQALIGKLVHYVVSADGYVLEAADAADADRWFEDVRPAQAQVPVRDLSVTEIHPLGSLGAADASAVGAKAANVAELRRILPDAVVPNGFAVPFQLYDAFFRHNGFYADAQAMMAEADFQADPEVRERALRRFRRQVRRGDLPPGMREKIGAIQSLFPPTQPLRCRSSTNNEDLEGFNGAGLYDSHTHRPSEGHLSNTIKQVWSKLWTYRAFEEREFYRIDHLQAAMGVLVHPNLDDEEANGVAVTKNIYDPNWPGFYVNVQVGEQLVTNPNGGATPDEFLVAKLGPQGEYETQYVKHTNQQLPVGQATILSAARIRELVAHLERIQEHFSQVYGATGDPSFAMDVEFKITQGGQLMIKQARPWVD